MVSLYIYNSLPILLHTLSYNYNINNKNDVKNIDFWLKEKIVVKETNYDKYNYTSLRLWKSLAFNDYYFEDQSNDNYLGGIDYIINNDNIKIEYHSANDKENYNLCNNNNTYGICTQNYYVNEDDSKIIKEALLKYIINIAKKNNIKKIHKDVHSSLKTYKEEYEPYGFKLTKKRCNDNPYWIISEKNI